MHDLLLETRTALRSLRRSPAFTFTALATLAVGIGLTTTIFSLVYATLLAPLPMPQPDRLVQVWEAQPVRAVERNVVNPGNYLQWKESAKSFASLSAMTSWTVNAADEGFAERLRIAYVTADFHQTLGASMSLGRGFSAADLSADAEPVVILSEALWRSRFAADRDILGREILLDGYRRRVIGVQPAAVDIPVGTQVWAPFDLTGRREARGRYLQVVGRLVNGATLDSARAEMRQIATRLAAQRPDVNSGWSATVVPMREQLFGDYRDGLWILFAATCVVLLVGCVNLSGLLVARNAARRHELAVRSALGAGRGLLARHLLAESVLLSAVGGALALGLARSAFPILLRWLPVDMPAFVSLELNGPVLAFALAVGITCTLLFGVVPAFAAMRAGLNGFLAEGGVRALGRRNRRARATLVACEVALSLALVATAGLLSRSLATLYGVDPGFRVERLLTAQINLAGGGYSDSRQQVEFFSRLEERLAGSPGIEAVGSISWLPLSGRGAATSYRALDRPAPDATNRSVSDVRVVTPGFFSAAGVRLIHGRLLDERDSAAAPPAVVINEFAARELWPGENPLGREVAMSWGEERHARVVGVVADIRLAALETEPRGILIWSLPQLPNDFMSLFVRTTGSPEAIASRVRAAVAEIDPTIPATLETMQDVIVRGTRQQRFSVSLLALFAALGLGLSAIGLYGLLASSVTERWSELGLRLALGAEPRHLITDVVRMGLRTVLVGIILSVPLVGAAGRIVASLLYRTSPHDPATLALAPVLLAAVGALACALPARRVSRIDPATVLREN